MNLRSAKGNGGIRYPFAAPPGPGEATEVAPGILWMRLPLPMALDHVNVYALDDGAGWTVIDTGLNSSRTRAAWEALIGGPLAGRPVNRVVVTHYHPDHIGLAGWFQSRGAELLTTRTSWLFARMLTLDVHDRPVPEVVAFWRAAGMPADELARRAAERPFNFADAVARLPLGYSRIADGGAIRMGGRTWDIRCGDGHAPEHATFWCREEALVIGGDQLLPSISANLGVYATEPDADPVSDWIESTHRFLPFATEEQLVLPGHKTPFTGLPLRLRQMIENHEGALSRLEDALARPRTAVECFPALYQRPIGEAEYGLALVEAVAHLNHLLQAGRATRSPREDGAWAWMKA
jgi:glyoxylase-like metal-dependent hydrolase (beta-lactamase superfamily II)